MYRAVLYICTLLAMKTARKSFALFYQHTINSGFIRPTLSHPFNIVLSWNIIIFFCCRALAFQIYIYFAVLYEHIKLCSSRPRCLRGAAPKTFRLRRSRWRIFLLFFCWKLFLLIFFPRAREFYGPSERHEDSQIVSCRSFRLLLRLRSSSRLQKNNIMFTCCERVLVVDKICKFFSLQTRSLASAESTFNCFRQPRTWRINSKCLSLGLVLIEKCFPNQ